MNILKEIKEGDSMKEMAINVKNNINFYLKHREELADIKLSNEFLQEYISKLDKVIQLYNSNEIPEWFDNHNPYLFISSNFPYNLSMLDWKFSFKDWVDILLEGGKIDNNTDTVIINYHSYTKKEWEKIYLPTIQKMTKKQS